MQLPKPLKTTGRQRIALLTVAKWLAFPVLPVLGFSPFTARCHS